MQPEDDRASERADDVVSLAEETLTITKRLVETGRVRVSLTTETIDAEAGVDLTAEEIVVERVAIGRIVTNVPQIQEFDGLTVIPVVEEVLVKQLVLREEIHLRRVTRMKRVAETQSLRRQIATVDRVPPRT